VPEVLADGVTGFVVDGVEEAVRAVGCVAGLNRRTCRRVFEERFDAARMARDYLEVYRRLVRGGPEPVRSASQALEPLPFPPGHGLDRGKPARSHAPLLGAGPGGR
jgi:hypothetical protein